MCIFCKAVLFLGPADGTILNGFCGTVGNTCHTVGTFLAPDRFAILQGNIVQRTQPLTSAAVYTIFCGIKILGSVFQSGPHRIERHRNNGFKQEHMPAARESLFFQICSQKPGHFTHVDRCTDDKRLFRMKYRMVILPHPFQQIQAFISQFLVQSVLQ